MKPKRPNILLTVADDQQATTIGGSALSQVYTPTLDRIMHHGACFTQAHHFGSCHPAVCAPSRAMLHTGRYYFDLPQALTSNWQFKSLSPEEQAADLARLETTPLLGEPLGINGYRTFGTGKWHNGQTAFNRSFQNGENIFFGGMCDHDRVPVNPYDPSGVYPETQQTTGALFSTDLFVEAALDFITSYDETAPFFLYLPFTAPHDPRTPLPAYDAMYPRDQINLPPNFLPDHPFDNGNIYDLRDEQLAPWPRTEAIIRQHIGDYYGMITHMDAAIGRLIEALEERGMLDNTLVVHTADHGLAVGQHGLLGKQNMYEHSIKVPLLMMGPGVPENKRIHTLTYQHDLFPTLMEIAGIEEPPHSNFRNLWPQLSGDVTTHHASIYSSYMHWQRVVKNHRYKLIKYFKQDGQGTDRIQIFDHINDPYELDDLSNKPAYASQRATLEADLMQWMRRVRDPLANDDSNHFL
jgi:arylsulfatase A-like enzyme